MKRLPGIAPATVALLASMCMVGCGGSDSAPATSPPPPSGNNPPAPPPPPPSSASTGVFLDAPVAGLSYTASPSGLSGTTDADGRFQFEEGDTVTFSVGGLVLGTVPAQGVVTPVTVAQAVVAANPGADVENVTLNLLVFLQSLDTDPDPDRIVFTDALTQAVTAGAIDFTSDAATFSTNVTTLVATLEGAVPDLDLTVVSREDASSHFVGQSKEVVAGTFVGTDADGNLLTENMRTLTFLQNGTYVYGGRDNDPDCNDYDAEDPDGNGVELGTFSYNPLTGEVTFTASYQTNGSCGPAGGAEGEFTLALDGDRLTLSEGDDVAHFARVKSVAGQITGSWAIGTSLLAKRPYIATFVPTSADGRSGRYLIADTASSLPHADPDENAGIETGCYSISADGTLTEDLDPATCPGAADTNGAAGLSGSATTKVELDAHGQAIVTDDFGVNGFIRLPLQSFTAAHLKGSRLVGIDPNDVAESPTLNALTVFEDGQYILGTQEGDGDHCGTASYPMPWQDGSDGAEYGTLSFVPGGFPGEVTSHATRDSNGECGLYDATRSEPQNFLFVRSASEEGTLLLFTNDGPDETVGHVLTPVPSEANGLLGVWEWEDSDVEANVLYLLPGGVQFSVEIDDSDLLGVHRAKYSVNAAKTEYTETTGPEVPFCTDTVGAGADNACEQETETNTYTLVFDGDQMTLEGDTYLKLTSP